MGVAVRNRRHSYCARLRIDLSCATGAQILHHSDPNLYPVSAIFFDFVVNGRLVSPVQFLGLVIILLSSVGITQGWKLPRIFRCPGKALPFSDGHEVTKVAEVALDGK